MTTRKRGKINYRDIIKIAYGGLLQDREMFYPEIKDIIRNT